MEETPETTTLEGDPSVISNEQTTVFVNQTPVLPVQKNQAAKVIGILVIIWGAFNLLGAPLTLLLDFGATDFDGNPISYPTEYYVVSILAAISAGSIAIYGGYQMTQYQKKGIWLTFVAFAIAWISTIVAGAIQGNTMDTEGTGFGAGMGAMSGVCGIFCYAICGIIVAIPLMLSDGGME
jgi:hypothetical protein